MSVVDSGVAPLLYRIRAVFSVDPAAGLCGVTSACHFAMVALRRIWLCLKAVSTSLAQWFNKYHAGLEVMGSIPMGDFHI